MLKDFYRCYSYLNPGMSYRLCSWSWKTSGYDGVYDNAEYFDNLYELNNENIVPTSQNLLTKQNIINGCLFLI